MYFCKYPAVRAWKYWVGHEWEILHFQKAIYEANVKWVKDQIRKVAKFDPGQERRQKKTAIKSQTENANEMPVVLGANL